jgi:quercetin dioxygenase-like cupin family protein
MPVESKLSTAKVRNLLGRDWALLLGPEEGGVRNVTLGYSIYPSGSVPADYPHDEEEELIYVVAGQGRLILPEPGVAVHIPVGVDHATATDSGQNLELLTVFSPPVISGSHERRHGES